jgi:hypothetical protein
MGTWSWERSWCCRDFSPKTLKPHNPRWVLIFVLRRRGHKLLVLQERTLPGNEDLMSERRTGQDKDTLKKKGPLQDLIR